MTTFERIVLYFIAGSVLCDLVLKFLGGRKR